MPEFIMFYSKPFNPLRSLVDLRVLLVIVAYVFVADNRCTVVGMSTTLVQ